MPGRGRVAAVGDGDKVAVEEDAVQLLGVADGGRAGDVLRTAAAGGADAVEAAHDVEDVAAEDAAVGVELVDDDEAQILEKFNPDSIISCMYYDGELKNYFIKRFQIETSLKDKEFKFINDKKGSRIVLVSLSNNLIFKFNYHSKTGSKKIKEIAVDEFVTIKGWKSIGNKIPPYKRMSGFESINLDNEKEKIEEKSNKQVKGDNLNLFE